MNYHSWKELISRLSDSELIEKVNFLDDAATRSELHSRAALSAARKYSVQQHRASTLKSLCESEISRRKGMISETGKQTDVSKYKNDIKWLSSDELLDYKDWLNNLLNILKEKQTNHENSIKEFITRRNIVSEEINRRKASENNVDIWSDAIVNGFNHSRWS